MTTLYASLVGLALCVFCGGCADPSTVAGDPSVCRQDVLGAAGKIRPETSGLSCAAIDELTFGIPSEPQAYSIMGRSPQLLWNCRLYAAREHSVLLRCRHREKHFTFVKT